MAAVRPVDLVEIDVVRLQPLQAGVEREADVLGIGTFAIADVVAARAGDLGRENDVLALAGLFEPGADVFLGAPLCFRRDRRRRIKFGCIEEVDALLDGVIHLLVSVGFGVLCAPGHGAEADLRNGNISAA